MSDQEDDFNPRAHNTLLQAVSGLRKSQHIRKTTRNEPKIKQDEFELVKGAQVVSTTSTDEARPATSIAVNDLVQVLRKKKKHIDAGKLLKNVQRTKKVFAKPLEKPAAERIKRKIGYEKVKSKLERWDAVVTKNRSAEAQVFPLPSETIHINTTAHMKPLQHAIKSDLRLEMEAAEEKLRQLKREREGDVEDEEDLEKRRNELHKIKMTRDELIARRKELAYLKIRESQQSAKARLRNKIKSKKYHKLLRRQKLQEQLKDFEQLQKTDPEAALEKLNEIEKSRIVERATLRHKNTGSWAKNLQVRAKYDKDVRKDLSEQLMLSRELTQKKKIIDDEDSPSEGEEIKEEPDNVDDDPMNPWLKVTGKGSVPLNNADEPMDENYRKYWLQRNRSEKLLEAYKEEFNVATNNKEENGFVEKERKIKIENNLVVKEEPKAVKRSQPKAESSIKTKKIKKAPKVENGWLVEEIDESEEKGNPKLQDIDDIFDSVEDNIDSKVEKKLSKLKKTTEALSKKTKKVKGGRKVKDDLKNLKDLSFKSEAKRPEIDEELGVEDDDKTEKDKIVANVTKITAATDKKETKPEKEGTSTKEPTDSSNIDPMNFPNVTLKQRHLDELNKAAEFDDAEMNELGDIDPGFQAQQMTISEAFEDDDIVADFGQEKSKDTELKNTEIDLSMPGWGSWAGSGIDESAQRKPKRLVLKLAEEEKRRDDHKGGLYINEEASKAVRSHLVSDLPFPFTSLQDYEASIRAPIGRNFVPETAFRMLTRPAVRVRKGAIIEPMDESELTQKAKPIRSVVDRRIDRAAQEKLKEAAKQAAIKEIKKEGPSKGVTNGSNAVGKRPNKSSNRKFNK